MIMLMMYDEMEVLYAGAWSELFSDTHGRWSVLLISDFRVGTFMVLFSPV